MKNLSLIALGALIAIQFAAPFKMIQGRENTLRNGTLFRFRTRPVDPADPFQGRYVRLRFKDDYIPCFPKEDAGLRYKEPFYALLEEDAEGFARFTSWSKTEPEAGSYLKTRYVGMKSSWNRTTKKSEHKGIRIDLPFNRFYMEESKAPRAEQLTREETRSTNCWANVRILNGKAVIEDVMAGGQSLRELTGEKE